MQYYFSKTIKTGFDEAISLISAALKTEGFGIISEIDMKQKLKEKLNVDFKRYKILGACNPAFAYKALLAEENIGVMLPCNVLVIDKEDGTTEIVAVNPLASLMAIQNAELMPMASEITERMEKVINSIS